MRPHDQQPHRNINRGIEARRATPSKREVSVRLVTLERGVASFLAYASLLPPEEVPHW